MNSLENVVVGLDGCPGGWIACLWREPDDMRFCFVKEPGRLFEFGDSPLIIGIDIPIGLVEGRRDCDNLARQLLGKRRSSVFPAPDQRLLLVQEYEEANRLNRQWHGKGLSKQTFNLLPKISEVDTFACLRLSPVFEVHPELAFAQMAGAPMVHSKRKPEGFEERRTLLLQHVPGVQLPQRSSMGPAKPDDWIDAAAVAWTARRIHEGKASKVPRQEMHDQHGLLMAIHF